MNEPENRWSTNARPQDLSDDPAQEVAKAGSSLLESTALQSRRSKATPKGIELQAILGAGTAFRGALSFSGRVRIDGQFEGSALGGDLLVIGEGAHVSGELRARRVVVLGGKVEADVAATESIELHIPAEVTGDLRSPQIYMDRGIQFHGTCDMTLDPPAVELLEEDSRNLE